MVLQSSLDISHHCARDTQNQCLGSIPQICTTQDYCRHVFLACVQPLVPLRPDCSPTASLKCCSLSQCQCVTQFLNIFSASPFTLSIFLLLHHCIISLEPFLSPLALHLPLQSLHSVNCLLLLSLHLFFQVVHYGSNFLPSRFSEHHVGFSYISKHHCCYLSPSSKLSIHKMKNSSFFQSTCSSESFSLAEYVILIVGDGALTWILSFSFPVVLYKQDLAVV